MKFARKSDDYLNWREKEISLLIDRYYFFRTNQHVDFANPKLFNEKIQWLKLYDTTFLKEELSDKYKVREYVKKIIGEQFLPKLIGVYSHPDAINFDDLPDKYALKANHGSGYNIIVEDKNNLDVNAAKGKARRWLFENYAHKNGWEMQYERIIPRLIIEEFIDCKLEYQFWCFNGEPEFISLIKEPHGKNEKLSFNLNWDKLDFVTSLPKMKGKTPPKPKYLNEMIEIARKLSKDFIFVRVDLIYDGQRILFSEMTFTPASGVVKWTPEKYDAIFGEKLKLKRKKG